MHPCIVLRFSGCSQRWSVMRIMFLLLPQSQLTPRDCQFWTAWLQLVLFLLLTEFDWVSHDHNCCLLYFLPTLLSNSWSLYAWDISTVQIVDLVQILHLPKLMFFQTCIMWVSGIAHVSNNLHINSQYSSLVDAKASTTTFASRNNVNSDAFPWPVGVYCCASADIGRSITFISLGLARCVQSWQPLVDTSSNKTHLIKCTTIYPKNAHQWPLDPRPMIKEPQAWGPQNPNVMEAWEGSTQDQINKRVATKGRRTGGQESGYKGKGRCCRMWDADAQHQPACINLLHLSIQNHCQLPYYF